MDLRWPNKIFEHERLDGYLHSLIVPTDVVAESGVKYNTADEYEYRDAEYEYKYDEDRKPEPRIAPKDAAQSFSKSISTARPR